MSLSRRFFTWFAILSDEVALRLVLISSILSCVDDNCVENRHYWRQTSRIFSDSRALLETSCLAYEPDEQPSSSVGQAFSKFA
jgi:hypothetical protein